MVMRIVGHRMRLTQAHVERMNLPRRFWNVRLDQISEGIRDHVAAYLKDLDGNLDRGEGLLFWGNNGVGKTSVAALIGMEARRRGASVFFTTAESLRQAVLNRTMFDEDQSIDDRARAVDVLILDDLGKEHPGETGFTERLFENLIRERSASKRTTIITTNLPLSSSKKGAASLMSVYIPSMMEVMKETLLPLKFVGENLRNGAAEAMASRMAVG